MKLIEILEPTGDFVTGLVKKLAPPLVTLLSAEPEIQYVALRNINLIVQKRQDILKHEMKVFFVKYNDPIYVKLEKLDIMIRLTNQANIAQVLAELKEYATEVDVDFVRKSVRAIGRCAIKVEQANAHFWKALSARSSVSHHRGNLDGAFERRVNADLAAEQLKSGSIIFAW